MVILIGGASCTGKTAMAQKLLETYHIPYLSIDHIKMGLIRGSRYCDFCATDSDEALEEKLWPVVRGIVMTNIENGQHIIIEGCYLPPEHIRDFEPEYLKHIISVYIGLSQQYIEKHYLQITEHKDEIEQRVNDDYINQDNLLRLNARLKERCRKHNAEFFEISDDYTKEMDGVYRWIDGQIRERRPFKAE